MLATSCSNSGPATQTSSASDGGTSGGPPSGASTFVDCKTTYGFSLFPYGTSVRPTDAIGAYYGTSIIDCSGPSLDGVVLELHDDATHALVPATMKTVPSENKILLTPNAPLSEGWYLLSVAAAPSGGKLPDPDRFHVGSAPSVSQFEYCDKGGGVARAVVSFSEKVSATSANDVVLTQGSKRCTYVDGASSGGTLAFTVECHDFTTSETVHLKVVDGLTSATGVPLAPVDGDIILSQLPEVSGCLVWKH